MGKMTFKSAKGDPGVGYLYLVDHPGAGTPGCVAKQVRILDLVKDYRGPDIYLDFDKDGRAIGVEVVG